MAVYNAQMEAYLQTLLHQKISLYDAVQSQSVLVIRYFLEVEKRKLFEEEQAKVSQTMQENANEQDILEKIVSDRLREQINAPCWYGMRLLHKACIRGSVEIAECLLSFGADTNVVNENGETPLHYAARKGNVYLLETLYQAGATCHNLDNKGRNATHHAASAGNVLALQWLEKMQEDLVNSTNVLIDSTVNCQSWLELRDLDGRTPLFLACEGGQREVVKFLLKRQMNKPSVMQAVEHSTGNNCLHAALLGGHDDIIYLCVTAPSQHGYRLLQATNHANETMVQMYHRLRRSSDVPAFMSWMESLIPQQTNQTTSQSVAMKYTKPRLTLLIHMLSNVQNAMILKMILHLLTASSCAVPLLIPPLMIQIAEGGIWASDYETWFKQHHIITTTLIYILGSLLLIIHVRRQSHRVPYSSRAPNPIFAVAFFSGLITTANVFFLRIAPVLPHNWLLVNLVMLLSVVVLFVCAMIRDPGWVGDNHPVVMRRPTGEKANVLDVLRMMNTTHSGVGGGGSGENTMRVRMMEDTTTTTADSGVTKAPTSCTSPEMASLRENRDITDRYCSVCELAYNSRLVKHCKLCERCVFDLDHHCLYFMRCVAQRNVRLFTWFILLTLISMLLFIYSVVYWYFPLYCAHHWPNLPLLLYCGWKADRAVSTMLLFNVASALWGAAVVYHQFRALGDGGGNYFSALRTRRTFCGRAANVLSFMLLGRFHRTSYVANRQL